MADERSSQDGDEGTEEDELTVEWLDEGRNRESRFLAAIGRSTEGRRARAWLGCRYFHSGVSVNGKPIWKYDVVGVHHNDGGKSATGDEMARIVELWEETEGEAAGDKCVLMRWFFQQKHLPPPHRRKRTGKKNKSRHANKEVFEECDNVCGPNINPVETIATPLRVLCTWSNPKNRIPTDDDLQKADAWFEKLWDNEALTFRSIDFIVDRQRTREWLFPFRSEEICNKSLPGDEVPASGGGKGDENAGKSGENRGRSEEAPGSERMRHEPQEASTKKAELEPSQQAGKPEEPKQPQQRGEHWQADAAGRKGEAPVPSSGNNEASKGGARPVDPRLQKGAGEKRLHPSGASFAWRSRSEIRNKTPRLGEGRLGAYEPKRRRDEMATLAARGQNEGRQLSAAEPMLVPKSRDSDMQEGARSQAGQGNQQQAQPPERSKPHDPRKAHSHGQTARQKTREQHPESAHVACCVYNLPGGMSDASLWRAISPYVESACHVTVADVPSAAWIWFPSDEDARLGREKLKSLCYESVGGLPLLLGPRDEVRRTEDGRGWHMKGNAFQRRRFPPLPMENADENEDSGLHYVPHFAQPGTLEYDFAKQWRALYRRHRQQVERLQEEQREELQKEVNRIWQNHS